MTRRRRADQCHGHLDLLGTSGLLKLLRLLLRCRLCYGKRRLNGNLWRYPRRKWLHSIGKLWLATQKVRLCRLQRNRDNLWCLLASKIATSGRWLRSGMMQNLMMMGMMMELSAASDLNRKRTDFGYLLLAIDSGRNDKHLLGKHLPRVGTSGWSRRVLKNPVLGNCSNWNNVHYRTLLGRLMVRVMMMRMGNVPASD